MNSSKSVQDSVAMLQRFALRTIVKNRSFNREIVVQVPLHQNSQRRINVRVNQGVWLRHKSLQFECIRYHPKKSGMYIRSTINGHGRYLHVLTMESYAKNNSDLWENGLYTCEHIDHDPTHNQRSNLRIATKSEQCASRRGHVDSKFPDAKGISETATGSFAVDLKIGPARYRKTVGKDRVVAMLVYDQLVNRLCEKCGYLNNPVATYEQQQLATSIAEGMIEKQRTKNSPQDCSKQSAKRLKR